MIYIPAAEDIFSQKSPLQGSAAEIAGYLSVLKSIKADLNDYENLVKEALYSLHHLQSKSVSKIKSIIHDELLTSTNTTQNTLNDATNELYVFNSSLQPLKDRARVLILNVNDELKNILQLYLKMSEIAQSLGPNYIKFLPNTWGEAPVLTLPYLPEHDIGLVAPLTYTYRDGAHSSWSFYAQKWHDILFFVTNAQNQWESIVSERENLEHDLKNKIEALLKTPQLSSKLVFAKRPFSFVYGRLLHLGDTKKLSYATQNLVNRQLLKLTKADPEEAYRMLGFSGSAVSLSEFKKQVQALENSLRIAANSLHELDQDKTVQLLSFGNHDDFLTAAIVLGDLDKATKVGVGVSGMTSNVNNMSDTLPGFVNLYRASNNVKHSSLTPVTPEKKHEDVAIVHWIGYNSPKAVWYADFSVFGGAKASAGAVPLAHFVDDLFENKKQSGGHEIKNITIFAHSYGSTTAAEALKITANKVNNFVTLGSAGLLTETRLEELNANKVYAAKAFSDGVANFGVTASGRLDPRSINGVASFAAGPGLFPQKEYKNVTGHSLYTPEEQGRGYLSLDTKSLDTVSKILVDG